MPFRLESTGDAVFDHRLIIAGPIPGWFVLSFRATVPVPPRRPMLRVLLGDEAPQDAILPGCALGRAHWLGFIPRDTSDILLALGPGLTLDRVGRRSLAGLIGECLLRRPGHGLAALYERMTGQVQRSRNTLRGGIAVTPLRQFARWAAQRTLPFTERVPPVTIACIVLVGEGEGAQLERTLASLAGQSIAPARIVVASDDASVRTVEATRLAARPRPEAPPRPDPSGSVSRRREGPGEAGPRIDDAYWDPTGDPRALVSGADALCLLRAGDELSPDALALLATNLDDADLVYADEIGADGLPRLKPDWSPDLALATGYVGRAALYSMRLIERMTPQPLGPLTKAHTTFAMAAVAACRLGTHVPRPLMRTTATSPTDEWVRALPRYLESSGHQARADAAGLVWPMPDPPPPVSVVIPSKDRLDLIRPACRGVLEETDYPAIELIVVDNGSTDPSVLTYYEELRQDPRVRILPYPEPFNFAAMVNAGVALARGQVVVLLNNDVSVRDTGWLSDMVRQAVRPEVGAVGAKLLFGDGTLQHAGVVVGLSGRAGHILRRRPAETPGHLGRLRVAHEVSAVTAACLAVSIEKYRAVGGFDSVAFPVDFNDVDFCLRLQAAGWKCVWTPAATLSHFESISRGPSVGAKRARFEAEAARFTDRWRDVIRHDPYYHPALSLTTYGEDLE